MSPFSCNHKTTNAYTEGAHTKMKLIKRLSYGYRNVEVYIKKVLCPYFCFHNLLIIKKIFLRDR
ncbi:MAG: transposase [Candidatus Aminicenantes bacterium]|nr:transposase [Candidatus Aminicenantes bacterium]